jgi:hypothetical protein
MKALKTIALCMFIMPCFLVVVLLLAFAIQDAGYDPLVSTIASVAIIVPVYFFVDKKWL